MPAMETEEEWTAMKKISQEGESTEPFNHPEEKPWTNVLVNITVYKLNKLDTNPYSMSSNI